MTYSLMFIQVSWWQQRKKKSSQARHFLGRKWLKAAPWPQQTQSHHSSLAPAWLCLSINFHPPQLPRLDVYPLLSGQRRDFICVPWTWQQRTRQQFQCFHTKPFLANQNWVWEKNGRGEDLVEVLEQPASAPAGGLILFLPLPWEDHWKGPP